MMWVAEIAQQNSDLIQREFAARDSDARIELRNHGVQLIDGCSVGHALTIIKGQPKPYCMLIPQEQLQGTTRIFQALARLIF